MVFFDHIYTADNQHRFLSRLVEMGFILDERQTEHPGGHLCRFIYLSQPQNPRGRFYLEFIHVLPGGERIVKPGLSLGYSGHLETLYKRIQKDGRFSCEFSHRNYFWRKGDRSRQPGWNFLTFRRLGFRGLYPWLTEHENAPFIKAKPAPKHPNEVLRHVGFEMELNEKSCGYFSYLLGRRLLPVTKLQSGTDLYIKSAPRTRLNSVILKCSNVNRYISRYAPDEVFNFHGQKAARIVNPGKMWDVVVI